MEAPVLVLGMHRSGTSALTRCINLLGVPTGRSDDLVPGGEGNPKGYWESGLLQRLNDEILAAWDATWDAPPCWSKDWPEDARLSELRVRAAKMLGDVFPTGQWVWKDPRNCLTLPFWRTLIPAPPRVVFIWRNPVEVGQSLLRAEGLAPHIGIILWTLYNAAALRSAEGLPMFVVSYDSLLRDSVSVLERLGAFLGKHDVNVEPAVPAEAVRSFLDPDLRHFAADDSESQQQPQQPCDERAMVDYLRELPEEHEAFQLDGLPLGPGPSSYHILDAHHLWRKSKEESEQLSAQLAVLAARQTELEARAEQIPVLKAQLEQAHVVGADLERQISEARTRQAHLESKTAEKDTHIQNLETTLSAIYCSKGWQALSIWRKVKYGFVLRVLRAPSRLPHLGSAVQDEPAETQAVQPSPNDSGAASPQTKLERIAALAGAPSLRKVASNDGRRLPLPEHLRVLYVTNRYDAPYRYRCLHPCLHLRAEGVACDIVHLDDSELLDLLSRYSVVVLFRLPWSSRVATLVRMARESGLSLIFDVDDLVFEPGLVSSFPFLVHASGSLRRQYEWTATRLCRTLDACDAFLGATPALARAAEKRGKRAFVYPNLLHPRSMRASRRLHALRGLMQRRPIITYMSGSMTHDEDFALISPVLAKIMSERRETLLLIGGFLDLGRSLEPHADRIIRLPFQDWRVQPWAMNLARVNLAPLAVINEFTNSKSALKFFEAAVVGLPTVATPAEQFQAAIRHGVNGYLADDADAWHESITACLDEETSRRIGHAARQTAFIEHTHAGHHHCLRDILLSVNGKAEFDDEHRPLPVTNAETTGALNPISRLAARGARTRAVIGIIRRAGKPGALSRPDLCRPQKARYDHVSIDPPTGAPDTEPDFANTRVGRIERNGRFVALQLFSSSKVPALWSIRNSDHSSSCDEGGEWLTCKHSDPSLVSAPVSIRPEQFATLVIGLAAKSDLDDVFAQLFWTTDATSEFAEKASITFPVVCDGRVHRYVVSLADDGWPKSGPPIVALRFDPLNMPGSFRLEYLALLPTRPCQASPSASEGTATSSFAPSPCSICVDIVVPIYEARQDVQLCVESVLRHANGDWRLILVDDASADEALLDFLRRTAEEHPRVVLLRNQTNSGFVVSANRGMRAAHGRDVLLLNSDTIVTEDFLSKLIACVYADKHTGIATPFTNNGTICSIPNFCQDNALPEDMSVDEYGRLVSSISLRRRPELVTAVGFCMYIRAEVLEKIGYFDEEHFGRGFGEENDFCERAKAVGYLIRLCDDLFIAHTGKASFGDEGRELERLHGKVMDRMHPRYSADVAAFCACNPLQDLHANIHYHLARRNGRRYPAGMFLLHASVFTDDMGGTEHVVRDLVENLKLPRALIVFLEVNHIVVAEVFDGNVADALLYRFPVTCARPFFSRRDRVVEAALERIIDLFNVGVAHFHHLMHWPIGIWRALHGRGVPYYYTIHDYYCVCPSWNLLNRRTGLRCACANDGTADVSECIAAQYAVLDLPAPRDPASLLCEHRSEFGELLAHAEAIVAPSQAAYDIVRRRYRILPSPIHVIGHGYDPPKRSADFQRRADEPHPTDESRDGRPLRVALVGQVAYPAKGSAAYLELLERLRSFPIEWHVFGDVEVYAYRRQLDRLELGDRLHLHGAYRREEICDLLVTHAIELTVLLPTCDETFCFTLSESWLAGVPAIVSNVGALPERVLDSGAGIVVADTQGAFDALRRLVLDRGELATLQAKAASFRHPTLRDNADLHRQAYGRCWEIVTTPNRNRDITGVERELFAVYHGIQETAGVSPMAMPSYHTSWWYPFYLRMKPFMLPRVRGFAKRMYTGISRPSR